MYNPTTTFLLYDQYHPIHEASFTTNLSLPDAGAHPMFYVGIYAAISLGGGLVSLVIVAVQYFAALRASRKLFKQLLITVIHATMRWFDTTPQVSNIKMIAQAKYCFLKLVAQGRLLNRFSKARCNLLSFKADSKTIQ
jgi:ABC-type multidrug transport system fused ATPase/permease subunit